MYIFFVCFKIGDIRMKFAENPKKVENIVDGNFANFKSLYEPLIDRHMKENRSDLVELSNKSRKKSTSLMKFKVCQCLLNYIKLICVFIILRVEFLYSTTIARFFSNVAEISST